MPTRASLDESAKGVDAGYFRGGDAGWSRDPARLTPATAARYAALRGIGAPRFLEDFQGQD
jgi:hypothetical protein